MKMIDMPKSVGRSQHYQTPDLPDSYANYLETADPKCFSVSENWPDMREIHLILVSDYLNYELKQAQQIIDKALAAGRSIAIYKQAVALETQAKRIRHLAKRTCAWRIRAEIMQKTVFSKKEYEEHIADTFVLVDEHEEKVYRQTALVHLYEPNFLDEEGYPLTAVIIAHNEFLVARSATQLFNWVERSDWKESAQTLKNLAAQAWKDADND